MLRIDKGKKTLIELEGKTMRESGYWERRDLQEMICRSPEPFCNEIGEQIRFVGTEVLPTDVVLDRIDLLGIDEDGAAVIVEIKRDSHKLHLLQALAYAGMVAKWEPKRFIEELYKFNNGFQNKGAQTLDQAKEELEDWLEEGEIEALNRNQRIVLLAEEFDYEVLVTAEWLTQRYDVDVRCYRIALAKNGNDEFVTCNRAYPPPELTAIALRRRKKRETGVTEPPENWDEALKPIENPAVRKFFEQEKDGPGRSSNPKYRSIRFFVGGRLRFIVSGKRQFARVRQQGRFDDDIQFWKSRLGEAGRVTEMESKRKLRFYLSDEAGFNKFKTAVMAELSNVQFHRGDDLDDTDQTNE